MHKLRSAKDCVYGTRLDALGAPNTLGFTNERHLGRGRSALDVELDNGDLKQMSQLGDGFVAAGRAFIDRFAARQAFGIRLTAWMAALATLGLWQQGINALDQAHAESRPWVVGSVSDTQKGSAQAKIPAVIRPPDNSFT
jgi:hypothetical protein